MSLNFIKRVLVLLKIYFTFFVLSSYTVVFIVHVSCTNKEYIRKSYLDHMNLLNSGFM